MKQVVRSGNLMYHAAQPDPSYPRESPDDSIFDPQRYQTAVIPSIPSLCSIPRHIGSTVSPLTTIFPGLHCHNSNDTDTLQEE
ncbi:hypothetical protein D3C74_412750 [compost metagenome]